MEAGRRAPQQADGAAAAARAAPAWYSRARRLGFDRHNVLLPWLQGRRANGPSEGTPAKTWPVNKQGQAPGHTRKDVLQNQTTMQFKNIK